MPSCTVSMCEAPARWFRNSLQVRRPAHWMRPPERVEYRCQPHKRQDDLTPMYGTVHDYDRFKWSQLTGFTQGHGVAPLPRYGPSPIWHPEYSVYDRPPVRPVPPQKEI